MTAITRMPEWTIRRVERADELSQGPNDVDFLRAPELRAHERYLVCFAVSPRAIEAAQRLRFETFNVELGEGLAASWQTGLDQDPFDAQMTHLVLLERRSHQVVGTYRLQTGAQAAAGLGYYAAQEFDLQPLAALLPQAVEAGRACLHPQHRNPTAIMQLWQGIKAFLGLHGLRYLFGCCSITTTDPRAGWQALRELEAQGWLHPTLRCPPRTRQACGPDDETQRARLPKLFRTYCELGATVVSDPALDPEFGTVDFLALQDASRVNLSALREACA